MRYKTALQKAAVVYTEAAANLDRNPTEKPDPVQWVKEASER